MVGGVVLPVAVPYRCDHTRSADRELHFLIGVGLQTAFSVHRLDYEEGKVLSVGLHFGAVRSYAQSGSLAGGARTLSATAWSPRTPTAFNVPGAYGTENVALNS